MEQLTSKDILCFWILFGTFFAACDSEQNKNFLNSHDYCRSVGFELGKCVPLQECMLFSSWLKQRPVLKQHVKTVVKYTCYFHLEQPKACCPLKEIKSEQDFTSNNLIQDQSQFLTLSNKHQSIQFAESTENQGDDKDIFYFPQDEVVPTRIRTKVIPTGFRLSEKLQLLPRLEDCGNTVKLSRQVGTFGAYPWIALLGYKDLDSGKWIHICSGSIINGKYVLTAATCVTRQDYPITHIRVGEYDLQTKVDVGSPYFSNMEFQEYPVEKWEVHQEFQQLPNLHNNIALVRIQGEFVFGAFVTPICLPLVDTLVLKQVLTLDKTGANSKLLVAGWGRLHLNSSGYRTLQEGQVGVTLPSECDSINPQQEFCVGGRDALCVTDAGGALLFPLRINPSSKSSAGLKVIQVGVLSKGPDGNQCPTTKDEDHRLILSRNNRGRGNGLVRLENVPSPATYTKVHEYLRWILATLQL